MNYQNNERYLLLLNLIDHIMRLLKLFLLTVLISTSTLSAQVSWQPSQRELMANLSFLSSPLLEGREAGKRGELIAAEYIATMMNLYGLQPAGDWGTYFQDFDIIRTKASNYGLSIVSPQGSTKLMHIIDFTVSDAGRDFELEAPIVFAGYGLSFPENGYDDYKGLAVKNKIVVVIDGFPTLPTDTVSTRYRTLKAIKEKDVSLNAKQKTAAQHGAVAILVMNLKGNYQSGEKAANWPLLFESSSGEPFPAYVDAEYALPSTGISQNMPTFTLGKDAGMLLVADDIAPESISSRLEKSGTSSITLKPVKVRLSAKVENDVLRVRNVLGMVKGVDTTKYIVVSAHYDHLGRRGDAIYCGADDNASGVSGMLSIAKHWAGKEEKPAYNLIFAAWTAEEKGMLGSKHFVQKFPDVKQNVLLNMNFDMISRQDIDDPENKTLYVGILKGRDDHAQMVKQNSDKLGKPFTIDSWETTGNGGSDYIAFSAHMIPVMAFFSGMHKDYHLPLDTKDKVDTDRMVRIVTLANACLTQLMQELR